MSYLNITTNAFEGHLTVWGIDDEAPLVDKLVYVTLEAYKGVCKKYKKSNSDYMELRAYYLGQLLRDILDQWGYEVKEVLEGAPVTCEASLDEIRKINCKVEFGTHKYFLEEFSKQGRDLNDLKENWGFCHYCGETEKRVWPLKDKVLSLNIEIGIKFTDPIKEEPVEKGFMFNATIHEVIHLIDDIRKYYSKDLAFKIAEPLLKRVLTRFFIFEAIKNYTEND